MGDMTGDATAPNTPTTTQAQPPFTDALNSALDEIDRLTQKRDDAKSALDAIPSDGKHTTERARAAQSLQEFENQLSIASRKVTEIVRQQNQVAARPNPGGAGGTPKVPVGWTNITPIKNADGTTTYYGKGPDGNYGKVPGLPTGTATSSASSQPPSDPSKWQPIYEKPGDPSSRVLALQDPVTGDRVTPPADAADKLADGTTKDTIESGRQVHWVAKGGQWTIQTVGSKIDATGTPQDGQKRRSIQGQYAVTEVYHNGVWSLDDTTPPTKFDPGAPKEGDVRPNTDNKGQAIQEVYRGGSWVTDTSVAPKPFGTQAPTTVATTTDQPNIVQRDPTTGAISSVPNPNYRATDVAGRVAQLKQQAQAKRDELNAAVQGGQKTSQQAATEFDTWWSTNIDPYTQQLQQQQAQQQADEQRKQQAEERSNMAIAQAAGTAAVNVAEAGLPYRVGPGFGAAVNQIAGAYASGKPAGNLDIGSAVTFKMPDFGSIAQQATAQALAHLSPTAAGIAGQRMPGVPQGIDINTALNKANYAPTTTIAPDGTVTIQHQSPQQQPYQGAPNPNIFGSGIGNYVPPPLPPPVGPNG